MLVASRHCVMVAAGPVPGHVVAAGAFCGVYNMQQCRTWQPQPPAPLEGAMHAGARTL